MNFSTLCLSAFLSLTAVASSFGSMQHGASLYGDLKYGPGFTHFDVVNPHAPKGGEVRFGALGTFDSLNPLILKGHPAAGTQELMLEGLVARSPDEPLSVYGRIADGIDVAEDRSFVTFHINPKARFQDGTPIKATDVLFTFNLLKEKGTAARRMYAKKVKEVKVLDPLTVQFTFEKQNGVYDRELPVVIGLMSILPEHVYASTDLEKTGLTPLVGSGPYKIEKVNAGHSVSYVRDPNYWGKDLPVTRGFYNFDKVTYDYYANTTVLFEAFKSGNIDQREEIDPAKWRRDYDFEGVKKGQVTLSNIPHEHQVGMTAFAFNTRNPLFADPRVRRALMYVFDFDWMNKNLFFGEYIRTQSFFDNTELASKGIPQGRVRDLLMQVSCPKNLFEEAYEVPASGKNFRENLKKAKELLAAAGWVIRKGQLVNRKTGEPFVFEILLNKPEHEKIALAFARNLKQIGITASARTVDAAQYENRRMDKKYDMVLHMWGHSLSPGVEQAFYWSSKAADESGTRNYPGIKNKGIDQLCENIVNAKSRQELVEAVQALDLLLLWGDYVIPLGHRTKDTVAYWNNRIDHPTFGVIGIPDIHSWWAVPKK